MVDRKTVANQGSLYKKLLFTQSEVEARISEMASEIVRAYDPAETLFVSLLNGAQPFASKLMYAIQLQDPYFHPNIQSLIISRYGLSREPGKIRVVTDLPPDNRDLTGRHVVLIDDLIDAGETLKYARQHLLEYKAKQVDSIVLVKKIKDPAVDGGVAMFGFEAPDEWITGMGMDDERLGREANRWAGWIAIANDN